MSEAPYDPRELLEKPMSDFPDRPNLPGGKYFYGKLTNWATTHSKIKQTPGYHVSIRLTDPGKDVTEADLAPIMAAGFSIADYEAGSDFWLTPNSMTFMRRFLTSLGFPEGSSFRQNLALDEHGNPTPETVEKIRGLDVLIQTPMADDQGRVFLNNLNFITGLKKLDPALAAKLK